METMRTVDPVILDHVSQQDTMKAIVRDTYGSAASWSYGTSISPRSQTTRC
jgi:hypothetical protein